MIVDHHYYNCYFCSIKRGDKRFAETGVTEVTKVPTPYKYSKDPKKPNITLWDCPGIGSATFPNVDHYCRSIKYEKYDVFIILTASMFSENIGNLAQKLRSIKKPFLLARTKIDEARTSEKRDKGKEFNEAELLERCKEYCLTELKKKNVSFDNGDVFLISSHFSYCWDFPRLTEAIDNRLSSLKRDAFLFSMLALSEDIVKAKVERLTGKNLYWS